MRVNRNCLAAGLALCTLVFSTSIDCARAQQPTTPTFNELFANAFAKARKTCSARWSDHVFDQLRKRIPLDENKPTFSMLTDSGKLTSKDRALADLAIKTMNECRGDYAPVYAMLPTNVSSMIHGAERRQDDLVAQLYNGKISFGEFNVGMNEITSMIALALSGIPDKPVPSPTTHPVAQQAVKPPAPPQRRQQLHSTTNEWLW